MPWHPAAASRGATTGLAGTVRWRVFDKTNIDVHHAPGRFHRAVSSRLSSHIRERGVSSPPLFYLAEHHHDQ